MGNIDSILQSAVNEVNNQPEVKEEVVAEPVEKKAKKKKVEEVPSEEISEPVEQEQLDLLPVTKKKFKVKAYGKEKELEVKDDEIPNYVQKGYAAEEKWKEAQETLRKASEIEKRNEEFAANFKKDPESAMELLLGRETLDSLSEKRILRAMEMEKMSPEQREEYEVKQRLAKYKKEEEEYVSKKQKAEEEKQVAFFEAKFKDLMLSSLKKIGLEKPTLYDQSHFMRMVTPLLANMDGIPTEEDMEIVAEHFQKTEDSHRHEKIEKMSEEDFAKWIGPKGLEKARKYMMNGFSKPAPKPEPEKKEELKKMSPRAYMNTL